MADCAVASNAMASINIAINNEIPSITYYLTRILFYI